MDKYNYVSIYDYIYRGETMSEHNNITRQFGAGTDFQITQKDIQKGLSEAVAKQRQKANSAGASSETSLNNLLTGMIVAGLADSSNMDRITSIILAMKAGNVDTDNETKKYLKEALADTPYSETPEGKAEFTARQELIKAKNNTDNQKISVEGKIKPPEEQDKIAQAANLKAQLDSKINDITGPIGMLFIGDMSIEKLMEYMSNVSSPMLDIYHGETKDSSGKPIKLTEDEIIDKASKINNYLETLYNEQFLDENTVGALQATIEYAVNNNYELNSEQQEAQEANYSNIINYIKEANKYFNS